MPLSPVSPEFRTRQGIILCLALAAWTAALADEPPGVVPAPPDPVQLSEVQKVRLVLVPATVTTRRGKPVRGLGRDDFRLFEDGVPQRIDLFATEENSSIALAFLLDVSGSMTLGGRLDQAKGAIRSFVHALGPDDSVGLICFADNRVDWVTEFTTDRAKFLERLDLQIPRGKTALYDALAASPQLVDRGINGRKAIVLITDGLDNASGLTRLQATWLARRVSVPIYTLGFIPLRESLLPKRAREALRVLARFSGETGGALHTIHATGDLTRAVGRIQTELRFQYLIGYYPPGKVLDGAFHVLRLATLRDRLKVRTRAGYYANP